MPEIVFDKVEKRFGAVQVLAPLNLRLAPGEFTVLVGPSGCGKSTTLRMLAGLETLSAGEISFDGRLISRLDPKDRDIAMVFQDYALYPHMSVARNMSFALRMQRRPRAEIDAKIKSVADMLHIGHLLDRKPGELSGGQRQRVAMGRALARDAAVFLFDEPLSNLDAKLRARMRIELAELRQRIARNMVYVTHDQVEAMTLADRIVVMNAGVVQQQGTPRELFENPANLFVAGFLGAPAMNFFDATLTERDGRLLAEGEGYALALPDEAKARLAAGASREVVAGVRPSAFSLRPGEGAPIELAVIAPEYLGATCVLAGRCGAASALVETTAARIWRPGEVETFFVPPQAVRLFDKASGNAL